jgi:hypothetical protein
MQVIGRTLRGELPPLRIPGESLSTQRTLPSMPLSPEGNFSLGASHLLYTSFPRKTLPSMPLSPSAHSDVVACCFPPAFPLFYRYLHLLTPALRLLCASADGGARHRRARVRGPAPPRLHRRPQGPPARPVCTRCTRGLHLHKRAKSACGFTRALLIYSGEGHPRFAPAPCSFAPGLRLLCTCFTPRQNSEGRKATRATSPDV